MNRRALLRGMAAGAAGLLLPASVGEVTASVERRYWALGGVPGYCPDNYMETGRFDVLALRSGDSLSFSTADAQAAARHMEMYGEVLGVPLVITRANGVVEIAWGKARQSGGYIEVVNFDDVRGLARASGA